jgi:phosphoenolpyruvate phosphomutase / 2-hydroxyethylphosphonate cytidylyltransferase
MKKVLVCVSFQFPEFEHYELLRIARKSGEVIVAVLSVNGHAHNGQEFNQKRKFLENLKGVHEVFPYEIADVVSVVREIRPDYFIQASDTNGIANHDHLSAILEEWGGEVKQASQLLAHKELSVKRKTLVTSDKRRKKLKKLLHTRQGDIIRISEAHNALTALLIENVSVERDGRMVEFDGIWSSSLIDSIIRGRPDIEAVETSSRVIELHEIIEVTTKPIIFDGDTGGKPEHFVYTVRTLERIGVSAIIVEDKIGLKRNSLFGTEAGQEQETIENFCAKIRKGKQSQITDHFMIIARIESLILDKGMDDALSRAFAYIEAGADGIMIHSKKRVPDEVIEFCRLFREKDKATPIIVVPSTFPGVTEVRLAEAGANIVIYANHLLRASYPAMIKTAESILTHGRALECEPDCMPIKELLLLIPEE